MDMIDKRDQKEKMVRSIIKRRNVVYSPVAYTGASPEGTPVQQETAAQAAQAAPNTENTEAMAVLERLQREAAEDEAAKRAEIEKAIEQRDEQEEAIARILNEKEASRQQAMAEARGN